MKSGYTKIDYYRAIGVSIDHNGCAVFIFKEICVNDALAPQAVSNIHTQHNWSLQPFSQDY